MPPVETNTLLIGVVGFFLAAVYRDIREALRTGSRQQTLIELLQQAHSNHKASVETEIGYLKGKLEELSCELEQVNKRLDDLEELKRLTHAPPTN